MSNGGFIVSLDFELLWGLAGHDSKYLENYADNVRNAPEALREIIGICKKFGVKLTIAHVGAMTLSQYSDFTTYYSSPQLTSTYFRSRFYSGNIRCIAPQLSTESALFCCKAFLENIKAHLNVELGSHTFSHYYCLEEGQTTEHFEADIEQARKYALDNYKTIIFVIKFRKNI